MSKCSQKRVAVDPPKRTMTNRARKRTTIRSSKRSTRNRSTASRRQSVSKICVHSISRRRAPANKLYSWASRVPWLPIRVLQPLGKLYRDRAQPKSSSNTLLVQTGIAQGVSETTHPRRNCLRMQVLIYHSRSLARLLNLSALLCTHSSQLSRKAIIWVTSYVIVYHVKSSILRVDWLGSAMTSYQR